MSDDYEYDDDLDGSCWNCNEEGYVYDCVTDYACIDPEGGCDLCARRCSICNPPRRNPELDRALSDALKKSGAA